MIDVNGLWVPDSDAARFQRGEPQTEAKKTARAMVFARPGGDALDIGANVGVTARVLASAFPYVYAFEPVPEVYACLERNVPASVSAERVALSDIDGGFVSMEAVDHHTQLARVLTGEPKIEGSRITTQVPRRTVDSYHFIDISFMKIDVEGHELEVLKGAVETIERCRPTILMEQSTIGVLYTGRPQYAASEFLEWLGMEQVMGLPFQKDRVYRFPA